MTYNNGNFEKPKSEDINTPRVRYIKSAGKFRDYWRRLFRRGFKVNSRNELVIPKN